MTWVVAGSVTKGEAMTQTEKDLQLRRLAITLLLIERHQASEHLAQRPPLRNRDIPNNVSAPLRP